MKRRSSSSQKGCLELWNPSNRTKRKQTQEWCYMLSTHLSIMTESLFSHQIQMLLFSPPPLLFFTSMRASQLWLKTGLRDKARYIPIHELGSALGTEMVKLLPEFHALNRCCDSTAWRNKRNRQDESMERAFEDTHSEPTNYTAWRCYTAIRVGKESM